jgi:hypothetical protein
MEIAEIGRNGQFAAGRIPRGEYSGDVALEKAEDPIASKLVRG